MSRVLDARSWDLTRILLAVVAIGGLILASFWVLRPFLLAGIWAAMIVVASWPLMSRLERRLGGRRGLTVVVITLVMVAALVGPLMVGVFFVIERSDDFVTWTKTIATRPLPSLPGWIEGLPLIGPRISTEWAKLAATSRDELAGRVTPYARVVGAWLLVQAGSLGALFLQVLLTVVITAILYVQGETAARGMLAFARRLAGEDGEKVALLAAGAVRAVALGIIVTALVQSVIGGIGLVITGVPHALAFTAIMVMLGIAQIGPAPVMLGAIVWLFVNDQTVWGVVMIVWAVITSGLDNFLRPMLIKRGADLPLLLIFAGVIGGLLAFGLIGLFVGPVVLAVTYTLLVAWVSANDTPPEGPA